MTQLTRTQYKQARRLLRANGQYALRWLDLDTRAAMELVIDAKGEVDPLAERASLVAWCKRMGKACNVRHTRYLATEAAVRERDRRRTALAKFDRDAAMARRNKDGAA